MPVSDLAAPVFLLAMPQVVDPFFRKSVVLLLAHENEGSFGFVVNRRTELKVGDILRDLELTWSGDPEDRARFGGPVQPQVGSVLFQPAPAGGPELPGSSEVLPGLRVTRVLDRLRTSIGLPQSIVLDNGLGGQLKTGNLWTPQIRQLASPAETL